MKYRYAIVDTLSGNVQGTNDDDVAQTLSKNLDGDFFVIDMQECEWLTEGVGDSLEEISPSLKDIGEDSDDEEGEEA